MEREVTGKNSRGLVELANNKGHTSMPSMSCEQRSVSEGSTPTRVRRVGYQSAICMNVLERRPRIFGGRKPPERKAATRVPPSQAVSFCPLSGKLFPASVPPLSLTKSTRVEFHRPLCRRALVTFCIPESSTDNMLPYLAHDVSLYPPQKSGL